MKNTNEINTCWFMTEREHSHYYFVKRGRKHYIAIYNSKTDKVFAIPVSLDNSYHVTKIPDINKIVAKFRTALDVADETEKCIASSWEGKKVIKIKKSKTL